MAHDRLNSKLAVTSHSGDITVYAIDKCKLITLGKDGTNKQCDRAVVLTPIWTKSLKAAIPRAVFFHGPANSLLLILGLETGDMQVEKSVLSNSTHSFPVDIAEK